MTRVMAIGVGLAAVLGASLLASARPAQAIEYPWCFTSIQGGGENCGFNNFAQCQATLSGVGGFCYQNPRYRSEAAPRQQARWPR